MLKNKKLPNITDIYIKKCNENNLTKLKNIMAQNFEHISHIKNSDIQENVDFYGLTPTEDVDSSPIKLNIAKRPTADKLVEGEIAVNYKKGHETLMIKNKEGEIVGFINENDFNQAQEVIADAFSDIKVQINNVNGGINDLEERISTNENALNEVELVTASAFNDLNNRMEDSATKTEVNSLTTSVNTINEDNEYSIATAFNNINERIINLENSINIIQTQIANILTRLDNNRM